MNLCKRGIYCVFLIIGVFFNLASFGQEKQKVDIQKFLENIRQVLQTIKNEKLKRAIMGKKSIRDPQYLSRKRRIKRQLMNKLILPYVFQPKHYLINVKCQKPNAKCQSQKTDFKNEKKLSTPVAQSPSSDNTQPPTFSSSHLSTIFNEFMQEWKLFSTPKSPRVKSNVDKVKMKNGDNKPLIDSSLLSLREWLYNIHQKAYYFWDTFKHMLEDNTFRDYFQVKYCNIDPGSVFSTKFNNNSLMDKNVFAPLEEYYYSSMSIKVLLGNKYDCSDITNFKPNEENICDYLSYLHTLGKCRIYNDDKVEYILNCIENNQFQSCDKLERYLIIIYIEVKKYLKLAERLFLKQLLPSYISTILSKLNKTPTPQDKDFILNMLLYEIFFDKDFKKDLKLTYLINKIWEYPKLKDDFPKTLCDDMDTAKKVFDGINLDDFENLFFVDSNCMEKIKSIKPTVGEYLPKLRKVDEIYTQCEEDIRTNRLKMGIFQQKLPTYIEKYLMIRKKIFDVIESITRLQDSKTKLCSLSLLSLLLAYSKGIMLEDREEIIYSRIIELMDFLKTIDQSTYDIFIQIYFTSIPKFFDLRIVDSDGITVLPLSSFNISTYNLSDIREKIEFINQIFMFDTITGDFIGFLPTIDFKVAWAELEYKFLKCTKTLDLDDFLTNNLRLFFEQKIFWECIFKKRKFSTCFEEVTKDSNRMQILSSFLSKVVGNVPPFVIYDLDQSLYSLYKKLLGKPYKDYIPEENTSCCTCPAERLICTKWKWECDGVKKSVTIENIQTMCKKDGIKMCNDPGLGCEFCKREEISQMYQAAWKISYESSKCVKKEDEDKIRVLMNIRGYVTSLGMEKPYSDELICQLIEDFYRCCKDCLQCGNYKEFCTGNFTTKNPRKIAIEILQQFFGEEIINKIRERIKKFEEIPPFSDEVTKCDF